MIGFLMMLESEADRELLGAIYQETLPHLRKVAARFFPQHPHWAEDAIGDVFVAVAKGFERLRELPRQAWTPYLIVAVKNRCKTRLKQEGRWVELEEERWAAVPATEGLAEDYALAVEAIYKLKEEYREVLECRLVLGWSNSEIAHRLGISEETASKRFRRAKKLVMEQLRKEGVNRGG